jgi:quinol monooxygenase YgiN
VTSTVRYPVVELRQYTLRPGQRDVLIDLFDREFVESQEAEGMAIVGQFRDLDDPDRFVWIRGFGDMPSRARALAGFYGGPAWKANSAAANATMIDSDNVLLLRPVTERSGFPAPAAGRPAVGSTSAGPSCVLVTIYQRDQPFDQAVADFFDRQVRPALIETGATPLACLQTEHAENTFPALPVRTGENVFVWLARFPSQAHLDGYLRLLGSSAGAAQQLRLAPTARSLLR